MVPTIFFPFANYWWLYGLFTIFVLFMLALDLGVFHRKAHAVTFKEASIWSIVWVALAMLFNIGFYYYADFRLTTDPLLQTIPDFNAALTAKNLALEFLAGYVVEKSLAVDNIFVFVVVFNFFMIPAHLQHRVLFYGIIGALVFRAIFIALGSVLMEYHAVVIGFGVLLILTGLKLLFGPEKPMQPEKNPVVKLFKKIMPVTTNLEGEKFFVQKNKIWHATPLFIALLVLEFTDIIFAVDSVPAIFALTKEPLIVFTSNIFAILGLRSMYFMLASFMDKFRFIKYGLGLVLVFVGAKMVYLNEAFGGKFPISWSLGIIFICISGSIAASLLIPPKKR